MAVKTDGYITDTSSGDWRYSNTGQGTRGDVTSPFGDAYARFERQDGAIAGTRVDATGVISAGPVIDFKTLDSLLAGAPSSPGAPNIIWAGVSPLSLSEVLIVWNQPIVLLDKAKVLGGDSLSIAGRLMVVGLAEPIAIDGEEQATIVLQPGAVGTYGQDATCSTNENITTGEPSGELEPIPDVTAPCDCDDPIIGGAGDDAASGQGAQVLDARLYAEQLCQDGGCDPPVELVDGTLLFTSNNQMRVPVRCCHPFYLLKLAVNGDDGDCPCIPCPVWYASMIIYGSTIPGEVFPLDQLVSIADPCTMKNELTAQGLQFRGALSSDVACCGSADVQIVGDFGAALGVTGKWMGRLPGLAGQSVYFVYKNEVDCTGAPCQTNVYPDSDADPWVEEAILKPRHRALPVAFFDPIHFSTVTIQIPASLVTQLVTLVNTCLNTVLTAIDVNTINTIIPVTAAAMPTSTGSWFDGCTGTTIEICVGSSMTTLAVLTSCSREAVVATVASLVVQETHRVLTATTNVTVVTGCPDTIQNMALAVGPPLPPREVVVIDPDGDISIPRARTAGCDATWKFVMHNGTPQTWTRIDANDLVPCGPTPPNCVKSLTCQYHLEPMPNEVLCAAVNLLTPIWVTNTETMGSDGGCPGYDCSPENPPVPPKGSDVPNPPGATPKGCGILIRRPQRRPFVRCH